MAKTMDIVNSARKVDPTVWTLGIAGAVALGISVLVNWGPGVRKAGQVVEANPPILTTGTVTPAGSTGTAVAQAPTPSAPTAPAMTGPKLAVGRLCYGSHRAQGRRTAHPRAVAGPDCRSRGEG